MADTARQLIEVLHSMTKTKKPVKKAPKATVKRKPRAKKAAQRAVTRDSVVDGSHAGGFYTPYSG